MERSCSSSASSWRPLETTNELGKRVPVPDAGPSMGGPSGPRKIPSGGRYVKYLFFPNWAQIDAPGSYTVVCHRALNLSLATDPDLGALGIGRFEPSEHGQDHQGG